MFYGLLAKADFAWPAGHRMQVTMAAAIADRIVQDSSAALDPGHGRITIRTKSDLVRRLRDEDYDVGSYISEADERSVEVHMGNLRKKLGDSPQQPRWLQTVRGVGYRLAPGQH